MSENEELFTRPKKAQDIRITTRLETTFQYNEGQPHSEMATNQLVFPKLSDIEPFFRVVRLTETPKSFPLDTMFDVPIQEVKLFIASKTFQGIVARPDDETMLQLKNEIVIVMKSGVEICRIHAGDYLLINIRDFDNYSFKCEKGETKIRMVVAPLQ